MKIERKAWSEKMLDYIRDIEPGSDRAQAINIYHKLKHLRVSIAQMMMDDHRGRSDSALRASKLLVAAGLAKEVQDEHQKKHHLYGYFEYIDGSKLNQWGVV